MGLRRHKKRHVVLGILAVLVIAGLSFFGFLKFRAAQRAQAMNGSTIAADIKELENTSGKTGRFEATLTYDEVGAASPVSTTVTWDDSWFFEDSSVYNHELAQTSSVLAQLANAESNYYEAGGYGIPFMENALAELGFEYCDTESYAYRVSILDQLTNLVSDEANTVAYCIGSKHVKNEATGEKKLLIVVSARGTYQVEWLSDLNVAASGGLLGDVVDEAGTEVAGAGIEAGIEVAGAGIEAEAEAAVGTADAAEAEVSASTNDVAADDAVEAGTSDAGDAVEAGTSDDYQNLGKGDFTGFSEAGQQLFNAVINYYVQLYPDEDFSNVCVLLTGHSRGAAAAQLATVYLDEAAKEMQRLNGENENNEGTNTGLAALTPTKGNVFCYSFATPTTTTNTVSDATQYNNVFNILNPADLVARMPIASWGYSRYGTDLYLPEEGMDNFAAQWAEVKRRYQQILDTPNEGNPADAATLDTVLAQLSEAVPTFDDFANPIGIIRTVYTLATGYDFNGTFYQHLPTNYIAWMQTIEAGNLRTAR